MTKLIFTDHDHDTWILHGHSLHELPAPPAVHGACRAKLREFAGCFWGR